MGRRFSAVGLRYSGQYRLVEDLAEVRFGKGNTVFVGHMTDLFCDEVPSIFLGRVLMKCRQACQSNTFVWQTRNTERLMAWVHCLPERSVVGTTIETDVLAVGYAPAPVERAAGLARVKGVRPNVQTFVTVEPMLQCDLGAMLRLIEDARPDWVNVGLDTKGGEFAATYGATREQAAQLIKGLEKRGFEVRVKGS